MHIHSHIFFLILLLGYFLLLGFIAWYTSKVGNDRSNSDFFLAGRKSPWYVVAFGMIGATLSGITFISVPGWVGASQLSYMQMVIGFVLGYVIIAYVLLPIYYRLGMVSIYSYLEGRFGDSSYRTGALFFILSRVIGASFRLYLVALVLHQYVLHPIGIPFWITIVGIVLVIWLYTKQGGIKTIIWTDTLQTGAMLGALFFSIYSLATTLELSSVSSLSQAICHSDYSQMFFFDNGFLDRRNFFKSVFAGIFITISMTGLDQDMMQKNLSCKNLKEARINMLSFAGILVIVKFSFLILGTMLFLYKDFVGMDMPGKIIDGEFQPSADLLFPEIVFTHMNMGVQLCFFVGLIAAAFSSADSSLTALTTSTCIDILGIRYGDDDRSVVHKRRYVHILMSILLVMVILIFYRINDESVISSLFTAAGYTYGPLLGLFCVGIFTSWKVNDNRVPWICIIAPIITYWVSTSAAHLGYRFGYELLIFNALIVILGLYCIRKK